VGVDTRVQLGPLSLAHPLINASGTLDLFEVADALGSSVLSAPPVAAYVPKTVTLAPRMGNPAPRILETDAGMLNSIGLPNPGVEAFVATELPRLLTLPCPVILNVGGFSPAEYALTVDRLRVGLESLMEGVRPGGSGVGESAGADGGPVWISRVGLELNVSCPNVHSGCISIGSDPEETRRTVEAVREVWPGLLIVKLTPNLADAVPIARAAEEAGATAVSLVNTFKALALDRFTLRPYLGGGTGGLSGPAIKPLALRFVFEVASGCGLPIVGMGGVTGIQDVLEFLACGAVVVAVGSAGFRDPFLPARLAEDLSDALSKRRWTLTDVVGRAHRDPSTSA
jgi:dihydroorotate dehydrogenase (NAD+) catalytic subunit